MPILRSDGMDSLVPVVSLIHEALGSSLHWRVVSECNLVLNNYMQNRV
jgi:hypothetical protein